MLPAAGVGMDVLKFSTSKFTVVADALIPKDNYQTMNLGLEYNWNDNVFLRGGYKSLFREGANRGFTFGIGVSYNLFANSRLFVDISSEQFGIFKDIQRFSFGFTF